ncbi:HigA family addiction module antidote protein [Achromobacter sp. GG226]|uniref:HigA family addiction module antitoxin n=1 Tax=Verticiella alkaliphila TaxID=2779529 RepID=UPI00209AEAFD|nr:HigA family addiction module antitoxin [Verticiella sp. GG226]MBU4611506.1 HigA family addiction module antidote protein [Verticiella sp. GG226]
MQMHNPPHPGGILKDDVLPALGLSVTDAAAQLGVSRVQLSRFINGKAGATPDLAIRLAKWIPAPTAIMWLQMQADYDLWQAEHSGREWVVEPAHA